MNRRIILLGLLSLSVIVFSIIGYLSLKNSPIPISALDAVGPKVSAVLRINDYNSAYERLMLNNLMWQALSKDERVAEINLKILLFDSLLKSSEKIVELLDEMKITVAYYKSGNGMHDHTFIVPLSRVGEDELQACFLSISSQIEHYSEFEESNIYEVELSMGNFNPLFFTYTQGLLIASFKPDLVEDGIRILHNKNSIMTNVQFSRVEKTTGNFSYWNLFVNYQENNSMNFLGFNPVVIKEMNIQWSGWTALDATLHPDLLLLNGFSYASGSSFLSLFVKQKPQDIDVINIMPEDAILFFHFGVSNYAEYTNSKQAYLNIIGKEEAYKAKLENFRNTYHVDLQEELNKWVGNEFGIMYVSEKSVTVANAKVAYFRLSDKKRALALFSNLSGADLENMDGENIHQIPITGFLDDIETEIFSGLHEPYFTIIDKYILFSVEKSILEHIRNQYIKGNTLKKSEFYAAFSRHLSDQSNVFIYAKIKEGLPVYREFMNEQSMEFLSENSDMTEKFENIGIQFKDGKKDIFYQHTALAYNPEQSSKGKILWELALDTAVAMKPQIVFNHYTNAREIFVQDVSNRIYLIDNKGNIIWDKLLKEPIKSDVYQIDALKNNKLQILFSGESSIYLIDRKGNDVDNFPIQLPAVTTNGISVIDYEKNREYRIMIGVRGGEILNYDRFGKSVKGWKFKTNEEIVSPIRYFLLGEKDYVVTVGSEGTPYILNRRGEKRLSFNETLPNMENERSKKYSLELSNEISQCKFIGTDASGNFVKVKFNGEKEVVNLDLFSENHKYLYEDLNNDGKSDYIVLDSNRLMAYDHTKEKMFEVNLTVEEPSELKMYHFESGYGRIGFTDLKEHNIYLYRDAGSLNDGFPLKGSGDFTITDLNKDDRYNLIVGFENTLVVYNLE